jgi:predicted naringenin-chalcone synthase
MYISPISVANPPAFSQEELLRFFQLDDNPFASRIFKSSGIERRHIALTPELLHKNMIEREPALREPAGRLARQAIDRLDVDRQNLAGIIVASVGAVSFPSFAHLLHADLGLGDDVDFSCRTGDGCVGGIACVREASRLARESPGKHVLVVTMDLMSAHFGAIPDAGDRDAILNTCLFGDGCAAFLVGPHRGERDRLRVVDLRMQWVPNTLDHVVFDHGRTPPRVKLSKQLPDLARACSGPAADAFLRSNGLCRDDIRFWIIHPGGRAIIAGFQEGLGLSDDQVAPAYDVLRSFGNMGTPSSTFVMRAIRESGEPRPGDHGLMVTTGPGVTFALMLVRWEA